MALQTTSQSYFPQTQTTQPQTNQFLTGNIESQGEKAQTDWMNPENSWQTGSGSASNNTQPSQPTTPPQSGTAMGAIAAGNVGQWMPQGYDMGKWNNPDKHDPKYDVGRILSKYPPGPAGLQAAAPELEKLGFRVMGKDKIVGPDGFPVDVGQGFSGGMENGSPMNWWWNPSNPGPGNSYFGQQQGQGQQNSFMQMLMQMLGPKSGMNANPVPLYSGTYNFRKQPVDSTLRQPGQNPMGGNPIQPGGSFRDWLSQNNNGNTGITGGMDLSGGFGPNPDANGYFGGWQDETGLRHSGNQPGMSYML